MSEKLNCWPGCWAIVVRSTVGNEGKIVRCIKLASINDEVLGEDGVWRAVHKEWCKGDQWIVDGAYAIAELISGRKVGTPIFQDENLLPLRDDEGEDEMLRIAGLPNKEPSPAH